MFCISCGRQIEDGSAFCEHCGARQPASSARSAPVTPPPPAPIPPTAPIQQSDQGPAPIPPTAPVQQSDQGPAPVPPTAPVQQPVYSGQGAGPVQQPVYSGQGAGPVQQPVYYGQTAGPVQPIAAAKKPMSPKTRAALIVLAALVVLAVGAKVVLGSLFGPEKTINSFITAIQTQDAEALRKVVNETSVELTDEAVSAFFAAYGDSPAALNTLQQRLTEDVAVLKQGAIIPEERTIRLAEKSYVLFSRYSVEITPVSVTFYSEFENTQLQIAGQELTVGSSGTLALLLPGSYSASASYTDPDTGVTLHSDFEQCRFTSTTDFSVSFDYSYAYVEGSSSALSIKEISVDGRKYTGSTADFDFYNGFYIGPVNSDSKIRVVAEAYGMEFEQEFDLTFENYCYMTMELSDQVRQDAIDTAAAIIPDLLETVYSYDQAAFNRLTASGAVDGDYLSTIEQSWAEDWAGRDEYIYFMVEVDDITVDADGAIIDTYIGETYSAGVQIDVIINGTTGYIDLATGEYEADDTLEDAMRAYDVNMVYRDGRWIITGVYLH